MLKALRNKYDFILDLIPYTSFGLIRDITNIYSDQVKYENTKNTGNNHDNHKKIEYMNYSDMSNSNTNTNTNITEENMIELIQGDNGYYWIANDTTQPNYVYDITDITNVTNVTNITDFEDNEIYFSKRYTKSIIKNTNWCDYCLDYYFMHRTSIEKFIARCSDRFNKNHERFFQGKEAHMLGTILTIDKSAKGYLRSINMGLHNYYGSVNYKNDAQDFTIGGIVEQYNERSYTNNLTKHGSDYHDWLMKNNIMCSECERLACPFHYDNMGFNHHNICGLCVDGGNIGSNSVFITNQNITPKTNADNKLENYDLYD